MNQRSLQEARILVLLSDAFGARGGIAQFNRDFLQALSSFPLCESVIALPRHSRRAAVDLPKRLALLTECAGGKLRYVWCAFRTAIQASRLKRHRLELIVCAHLNLLPLACAVRRLTRWRKAGGQSLTPIVLIVHGTEAWQPRCGALWRWAIDQVDAVISVSEFTLERMSEWALMDRATKFILPNSVDLTRFRPGPKDVKLVSRYGLQGRSVLLTLARLDAAERYKGVDQVLEVIPQLIRKVPRLCYLIAGEGSDRARLEAKARALGLKTGEGRPREAVADVIFSGAILEEEKVAHYRLANAFAMPGWGEGFGIVYLEALACGLPVVGSQIDASRDLLRGCESAFVVNPHKPQEVCEGIRRALACSAGKVPRKVADFSTENFQGRVHQICEAMVRPQFYESNRQEVPAGVCDLR